MKIRTGFVSNSSTSSFCLYGAYVPCRLVKKDTPDEDEYDEDGYDFERRCEQVGLEAHWRYDDYVIGVSPSSFRDEETGAEFKERIKNMILPLLTEETPLKIQFITGEYPD